MPGPLSVAPVAPVPSPETDDPGLSPPLRHTESMLSDAELAAALPPDRRLFSAHDHDSDGRAVRVLLVGPIGADVPDREFWYRQTGNSHRISCAGRTYAGRDVATPLAAADDRWSGLVLDAQQEEARFGHRLRARLGRLRDRLGR